VEGGITGITTIFELDLVRNSWWLTHRGQHGDDPRSGDRYQYSWYFASWVIIWVRWLLVILMVRLIVTRACIIERDYAKANDFWWDEAFIMIQEGNRCWYARFLWLSAYNNLYGFRISKKPQISQLDNGGRWTIDDWVINITATTITSFVSTITLSNSYFGSLSKGWKHM